MVTVVLVGVPIVLCGGVAYVVQRVRGIEAHPRASEAKTYLKGACTGEQAFFREQGRYSEFPVEIGFAPERHNRYRYFFAPTSDGALPGQPDGGVHRAILADPSATPAPDNLALLTGVPASLLAEAGVHGTCPQACSATIVAAGNIDDDPVIDVWSVSTRARVIGADKVPAGVPFNHVDDTRR